jgi:exopolysaccharide biosynthesis predicted pyruvyltransferase EpsI
MSQSTFHTAAADVESSRRSLLATLEGARDITFFRASGNIGDDLIYAGTRKLLSAVAYQEMSIYEAESAHGHTAVVSGGGDWSASYHDVVAHRLPLIESRFEHVVVLPSSFDTSVDIIRKTLSETKALVFARERVSYSAIKDLCNAGLAHDCAYFFDFQPYMRQGGGLLIALRTDKESTFPKLPQENNDISLTCETLDEWLWTIARHEAIITDRAHVMIAGALLGKHVEYFASNYRKVPALADFGLQGLPVHGNAVPDDILTEGRLEVETSLGIFVDDHLVAPGARRISALTAWAETQTRMIEERDRHISELHEWAERRPA